MFKKKINRVIMASVILMTLFASSVLKAQQYDKTIVIKHKLEALEKESGGRLGIALIDTTDNTQILYRENERFPMASTSKVMVVAAVLKESEKNNELLNKKMAIHKADLVNYNPITEKYIGASMTLGELSAAALQYSDNVAMNKLLEHIGGSHKATEFARSIGDADFRLDRTEPSLNSAIPGDKRDTTTPLAMAKSLQNLTLGKALARSQRNQLNEWLKGNTTGNESIRAGVPTTWIVGDKTGSGSYGSTNDIAVIWRNNQKPLILVTYFTQTSKSAKARKDILASATKIVTEDL